MSPELESITKQIIEAHASDTEITHLCDALRAGDLSCRKQLADMICREPARLHPKIILEISRWGVNDDLSEVPEIRKQA